MSVAAAGLSKPLNDSLSVLQTALARAGGRAHVALLRLRLAGVLQLFDYRHLRLRARLILEQGVEPREVVVRLRVVGLKPDAGFEFLLRARVVFQLQVGRAEGDARVGERWRQPDGLLEEFDGAPVRN